MVGWLRKLVREMVLRAGLELVHLLMDEEVSIWWANAARWQSTRWEPSAVTAVMGQKVPVERPHVPSAENREIRLGSYAMFHRLTEAQLTRSTRSVSR
jgi:hypothetical protein